jgi:uncharacterized membrane protein YqjE
MAQTRAEAAALVVSLQKTAVMQGVALYAAAALAASASITAVIVLVAVAAPPEWRVAALGAVVVLLLLATAFAAMRAGRQLRRDAALIADFSKGLRLDLAMLNLALKDPNPEDSEELSKRERAQDAVREAAAEKASTPSTAEGGEISPLGPSVAAATAAARAASPLGTATDPREPAPDSTAVSGTPPPGPEGSVGMRAASLDPETEPPAAFDQPGAVAPGATEREMPEPPVTPPEAMTTRQSREHRKHGSA